MINLDALPRVSFSSLAQLSAAQTTVLTVNNRLTRRIVQEFAQQVAEYSQVSEMPQIIPWSGWVTQLLNQASFHDSLKVHALLLDSFGSQLLWGRVIHELEADQPLLDTQQAAIAAQQADNLIDEWMIEIDPASVTEEHTHFMLWRARYKQELARLDALDPNLSIDRVIEHVRAGLPVRAQLLLAGFTEITPRMSRLFEALAERGVTISVLAQQTAPQARLSRAKLDTSQDEWMAAAHWARTNLAKHPQGRYAIVAVGLESDVAFARRTLSRVLQGGAEDNRNQTPAFSYNVAVARPLSEWQAVRAVLAWLRTFVLFKEQRHTKTSELGTALLAGYCAGDALERGERANVDAAWRRNQISDISVTAWSRAIERLKQLSPAWHLAWQAWADLPRKASIRFWSMVFRQTLSNLGFPGRAKQSSTEYQVMEALDQLFERFDALTPIVEDVSVSEALSILGRLSRSMPFQPQRDPSARLDVLGMLEAEGGSWDGVWVLGLTDEVFPAIAKPNPFVPLSELRRVGAPRATPEREREWAAHMYQQLCALAPEVMMSHATHEGERGLRPSPLIADLPVAANFSVAPESPGGAPLDLIQDAQAPALRPDEKVRGGVALLETQARNPLWAFMRYRLGAHALPAYSDLPPASARGMFLHCAMEQVWKTLRSQDQLKDVVATGALREVLAQAIRSAAEKELVMFNPALRALEEKRAMFVLTAWLAVECERAPFVAEQIEEKLELTISGLTLSVRLDRMDRLADGSRVVLDYKGGSSLPKVMNDWQRERPVQLQLPAYAAVLAQEGVLDSLAGLVLVHLQPGAKQAIGLLREEIGLEGPTLFEEAKFADADWSAAILRLKNVVQSLAEEFSSGLAINQSWSVADLQYCDVPALIRRYDDEQQALDETSDAEMGDANGEFDGR